MRGFSELGVAEILGMGEITYEGIERGEKDGNMGTKDSLMLASGWQYVLFPESACRVVQF